MLAVCHELVTVNGAVASITLSPVARRQPDGAGGSARQRLVAESSWRGLAATRAASDGRSLADARVPLPVRERESTHGGGVSGGGLALAAVSVCSSSHLQRVRKGGAGGAAVASGDGSAALRRDRPVLHASRQARAGAGVEGPAGDDLSDDGAVACEVSRSCASFRARCWSRSWRSRACCCWTVR